MSLGKLVSRFWVIRSPVLNLAFQSLQDRAGSGTVLPDRKTQCLTDLGLKERAIEFVGAVKFLRRLL